MAAWNLRARNGVVGASLLLMVTVVGWRFGVANPERKALEQDLNRLDAQLVQQRAIARDRDRYRAEVAELRGMVAKLEARFGLDESGLNPLLGPLGAVVVAYDPVQKKDGRWVGRAEVHLGSREAVSSALERLGQVDPLGAVVTLVAGPATGALELACEFLPPEPPDEKAKEREAAWYGRVNEGAREQIIEKRQELERLRAENGEAGELVRLKAHLERVQALIAKSEAARPATLPVARQVLLGEGALLARGAVVSTEDGILIRGFMAPGVDHPTLLARLTEWKIIRQDLDHEELIVLLAHPAVKEVKAAQ